MKGITWSHSRGITPLLAVAQRYNENYPNIEIQWSKRSLQEFADYPIEKLTEKYDLLIIDHPWVGCANATNCVLPLNEFLAEDFLIGQQLNSVGFSHESYHYNNKQWALAIDAATPVASYRKDLFENSGLKIPENWDQLIALAKLGKVAIPAIPVDLLMNFYSFCIACGNIPFQNETEIIDRETGVGAIEKMKELYGLIDKQFFNCNPIAVAEMMTATDDYFYCPFAYGYSNYSRAGYAKNLLHYHDVIEINGKKIRTTLGGTGLAVSAFSQNKKEAIDFTSWICSSEIQQTLYVQNGGQPGHRAAWKNKMANYITENYFENTVMVLDNSYMRPRYNGYLHFQDHTGFVLQQCILNNTPSIDALTKMNIIYNKSLMPKNIF